MRDGTEAAGFEKRQVSAERPRPVRRTEIPWSAVLSTLSDRIPLVRYAFRAALAEKSRFGMSSPVPPGGLPAVEIP